MTTSQHIEWKVGGTVYVHANHTGGDSKDYPISKVGRTWAYLDRGGDYESFRAEMKTGKIETAPGFTYGWAWPSKEAYDAEQRRQRAWRGIRDLVTGVYLAPDGVSVEDINKAAELLRVKGSGHTL